MVLQQMNFHSTLGPSERHVKIAYFNKNRLLHYLANDSSWFLKIAKTGLLTNIYSISSLKLKVTRVAVINEWKMLYYYFYLQNLIKY